MQKHSEHGSCQRGVAFAEDRGGSESENFSTIAKLSGNICGGWPGERGCGERIPGGGSIAVPYI